MPKSGAWSLQGLLTAPPEKAGEGKQGFAGATLLLLVTEGATGICLQFGKALQPCLGRRTTTLRAGNTSEPGIAGPCLP